MDSVPDKLYRYRPIDENTIENLQKRQVYFSEPSGFNDPFDCAIRMDKEDVSDEEYWDLFHYLQKTKDNANFNSDQYVRDGELTEEFKAKTWKGSDLAFEDREQIMLHERGAVCFSAVPPDDKKSLLQWSHYAEGHTGLCLEFSTDFPLFNEGKVFKVTYSSDVPSVSRVDMIISAKDYLDPMVSTKADCWSYEKEWRLFHMEGSKPYGYSPSCLTAVYLGCDIDQTDRTQVKSILSASSTDLYQMHRDQRRFALSAEPLKKG